MEFKEIIKKYFEQGLSLIPIGANKAPTIAWKNFQSKTMSDAQILKHFSVDCSVGLVCGSVSGGLECIDVDCKYDVTGNLYEDYKERIGSELFDKLVVQATVNKGYHLIYRCSKIDGNLKLAEREATEQERKSGEKIKVLLETRGEGGFIAIAPTKGYKFIQRHLHEIPLITEEERSKLFMVAREFNQVYKEDQIVSHREPKKGELSPLEDYDSRGNVCELLVKHGWKIARDDGENVLFRRPGKTEGHSASYTRSKKWFTVFSSSSEFDQLKAYKPYAVYAVLECHGNFGEAAKKLKDEGYGVRIEDTKKTKIQEKVSDYLSSEDEDLDYLQKAKEGLIPMGLETGIPELDKYYRFKLGNFVIVNGVDNVGKSLVMFYLSVLSAKKHGWSWIIYAGENRSGFVKRKLIELFLCKEITAMSNDELSSGYEWVKKYFTIISNNDIYTYKNILQIGQELMLKKKYQGFLIDPYNSLSIEMDAFTKLSTHDYHYLATSEMRLFTKQNNCSVYLNCHAVTEALRRTYPKEHEYSGQPMPPNKADTEGGGKFSNRADDFITIHRMVQHETEWMWTQIHVRKIKETETGGRPTPLESPIKIKLIRGACGFVDENDFNAMTGVSVQQNQIPKKSFYEPTENPF